MSLARLMEVILFPVPLSKTLLPLSRYGSSPFMILIKLLSSLSYQDSDRFFISLFVLRYHCSSLYSSLGSLDMVGRGRLVDSSRNLLK